MDTDILYTHDGTMVPYARSKKKPTFNETNDSISWAAWSWNPVTGCLHGCPYCYARQLATVGRVAAVYPAGFTPLFRTDRLHAPANTKFPDDVATDPRRGRVFVCSMGDLFGAWVPNAWIYAVYDAMERSPEWEYLTLTKNPERYWTQGVPPRLWAGATIDCQARVHATEKAMKNVPAAVRWLSLEPLLEPLTFSDLSWCDLMVIGGRSATQQPDGPVPEFIPPREWVDDLVAQARAAGIPVYMKPNVVGRDSDMTLVQENPRRRERPDA